MSSIYLSELSTIQPNYKSQKYIKMLKQKSVICLQSPYEP